MNGDFFKELVNTIVFLLPVLALVWKGAKLTAKIEQMETKFKEKTDELYKLHETTVKRLDEEEVARQSDSKALLSALNDISKAIVRIETKLDIDEAKKRG